MLLLCNTRSLAHSYCRAYRHEMHIYMCTPILVDSLLKLQAR